jgi:hypothetical protein
MKKRNQYSAELKAKVVLADPIIIHQKKATAPKVISNAVAF